MEAGGRGLDGERGAGGRRWRRRDEAARRTLTIFNTSHKEKRKQALAPFILPRSGPATGGNNPQCHIQHRHHGSGCPAAMIHRGGSTTLPPLGPFASVNTGNYFMRRSATPRRASEGAATQRAARVSSRHVTRAVNQWKHGSRCVKRPASVLKALGDGAHL